MVPNPDHRRHNDTGNPPQAAVDVVLQSHPSWKVSHEHGADHTDMLNRSFRCRDSKTGMHLLEILQNELYQTNEKGCRIRRETQGMYYMCCDGVRVRLNEPKHELIVEVPLPDESADSVRETKATLGRIETLAAKHARGARA